MIFAAKHLLLSKTYRHLRNIHNIDTSKSEQRNCTECPFKSYSLPVVKTHVEQNMVQQNRSSAFTSIVSSLIQKLSINTYKIFFCCFHLHKPKFRMANYLNHLFSVVQCRLSSWEQTVIRIPYSSW